MSIERIALPTLQVALRRRYPGLKVEALIQQHDDEEPFRTLFFYGPRAALLAYGLATESANGELTYKDDFGSYRGGGKHSSGTWYVVHHLYLEGEPWKLTRPRKFPTKRLEADVRRTCKRLAAGKITPESASP